MPRAFLVHQKKARVRVVYQRRHPPTVLVPKSENMDDDVTTTPPLTPRSSDKAEDLTTRLIRTVEGGHVAGTTCPACPSVEHAVNHRTFTTSQKSAFAKVNRVKEDACTKTLKPDQRKQQANVSPMARHGYQRPTLLPPTLLETIKFSKSYQGEYGSMDHADVGRLLVGDVARMAALGGSSLANLQLMAYRDPRLPITNYWLYLSKLFANVPRPGSGTENVAQSPAAREIYPQYGAGVLRGSDMTTLRFHENTDLRWTDKGVVNNMATSSHLQFVDTPQPGAPQCAGPDPRDMTSQPLTYNFTPKKCNVIETEARPLPEMRGVMGSSSPTSPPLHYHVTRREVDPNAAPPTKKYKCDLCGKAFSRSNTLVTHRRIHTGEKPFGCEMCGRTFRQPGNLTRHRLTHTTIKPFVCSVCQKAFNRASNLHTHLRIHGDRSACRCAYCGQCFSHKADLKRHSYLHTGDRPHKCDACGKCFTLVTSLNTHRRDHCYQSKSFF